MRYFSIAGLFALGSAIAASACSHNAPPPMVPDVPEPIAQEDDAGTAPPPQQRVTPAPTPRLGN